MGNFAVVNKAAANRTSKYLCAVWGFLDLCREIGWLDHVAFFLEICELISKLLY